MAQITVISGVERRRRWDDDQKLALVEAALAPGASVAAVAREADVATSSIYRWRRELCGIPVKPKGFVAVTVHADPASPSQDVSDILVIEINGATIRASNATSANLLVAALRELKA